MTRPVLATLGLLAAMVAGVRGPQERVFDTEGHPPEMVSAARLAEARCTKCHTLRRVLRAEYVGEEWADVVQRMRGKRDSGITAADAKRIAAFFAFRSRRLAGGGGEVEPAPAPGPPEQEEPATAFDTAGHPPEMAAAARLTERRCTKCHSLNRVLRAGHVGEAWTDVVERMRGKRGSGISARDAERIAAFLAFRSGRRAGGGRREETPPIGPAGVAVRRHAFPRRRFGRVALQELPPGAELPRGLALDGHEATVTAVTSDPSGPAFTVEGRLDGDGFEVGLAAVPDGAVQRTLHEVRAWRFGPHRYRLVLALYDVGAPVEGARPPVTLALLVERLPAEVPPVPNGPR